MSNMRFITDGYIYDEDSYFKQMIFKTLNLKKNVIVIFKQKSIIKQENKKTA